MILALDLARKAGFALGEPGALSCSGSHRFASDGASHEAVFAAALEWTVEHLKKWKPTTIVYEAPMSRVWRGRASRSGNDEIAYGLPAIVGAVAHIRGIHDVRKADAGKVRWHFLGESPKRAEAKKKTVRQCIAMGFDPTDDNEADAIAVWHYMSALIDPTIALRPTSLFGAGTSP